MITILTDLASGEGDGTAEDWTNLLDRGGLCHISENTYMFFVAMEEEVQLNLQQMPPLNTTDHDNLKRSCLTAFTQMIT